MYEGVVIWEQNKNFSCFMCLKKTWFTESIVKISHDLKIISVASFENISNNQFIKHLKTDVSYVLYVLRHLLNYFLFSMLAAEITFKSHD